MGTVITHGGKLPLDILGWIGEKSFTRVLRLNIPGMGTLTPTGGYF
mgnify:FL=1